MNRVLAIIALPFVVISPVAAQKLSLAVGGVIQPSRRVASLDAAGGTGSGTMTGLDGMIRVGMLRAEIRIGSGEFASDSGVFGGGKVTSASGALGFGGRTFWVTGGVGRRAYSGSLGRRVWSFTQVSAGISLGLTSSLRGEVSGGSYLGAKEIDGPTTATGRFAQTALRYEPGALPVYLVLGYRAEIFTPGDAPGSSPDEVSGLIVGGGIRVGR